MSETKTYKIDQSLWFTWLKPTYEAKTESGKKVIKRLAKGEESLVMKEQSEFAKPYRLYMDGEYFATGDVLEQEWIENHPDYGDKITHYDPAKIHKDNVKALTFAAEVMGKIFKLEETEKRGVGYRIYGSSALSNDTNELTGMLVASANEDPEKVNTILDEKNETDFALIGVAMAKEIIKEEEFGNKVVFSDTGELITSVRKDERPIDALVDLFKTNEGRELKKIIFQKLRPVVVDEVTEEPSKAKAAPKGK